MCISKEKAGGMSGGIFLIGIGIIFWLNLDFFPWILVVIALAALPGNVVNESWPAALQELVWLIGLAVLFGTGTFWPGILILIGLSIIAGALAKPEILQDKRKRGEEKPKRGSIEL